MNLILDKAEENLADLLPISTENLNGALLENEAAKLEAVVSFRGRLARFDFTVRTSKEQSPENFTSFIDNQAVFTQEFARETAQDEPSYGNAIGIEKAFLVRSHMLERVQLLGEGIFPEPKTKVKVETETFYDRDKILKAGSFLLDEIRKITEVRSLWLYGSALQTKRQPNDIDFKAVTDEFLTFDQYRNLIQVRTNVRLGNENVPADFSLLDIPTWKALYPLEDFLLDDQNAFNFTDNNLLYSADDKLLELKVKLIERVVYLFRIVKKFMNDESRGQTIDLCTKIPAVLNSPVRQINMLTALLKKMEVKIPDIYNVFSPKGTVEQKLEAIVERFYYLASLIPKNL